MSGFTKLVPEIIQSSIWNETSDIRIVWITLLAIKDEAGYVRGDARTIARLANVPLEVTQTALELLQAPDESSNTPDNDGRRIAPLNGGWVVLNHELYRARDAKAEHAAYVKKWRNAKKAKENDESDTDVNKCESHSPHVSASASVSSSSSSKEEREMQEGEKKPEPPPPPPPPPPKTFKQWNKEDFIAEIKAANYDNLLSPAECIEFFEYWTEPDANGKFRLTLDKTWQTRRRMKTAVRIVFSKERAAKQPSAPPAKRLDRAAPGEK